MRASRDSSVEGKVGLGWSARELVDETLLVLSRMLELGLGMCECESSSPTEGTLDEEFRMSSHNLKNSGISTVIWESL